MKNVPWEVRVMLLTSTEQPLLTRSFEFKCTHDLGGVCLFDIMGFWQWCYINLSHAYHVWEPYASQPARSCSNPLLSLSICSPKREYKQEARWSFCYRKVNGFHFPCSILRIKLAPLIALFGNEQVHCWCFEVCHYEMEDSGWKALFGMGYFWWQSWSATLFKVPYPDSLGGYCPSLTYRRRNQGR